MPSRRSSGSSPSQGRRAQNLAVTDGPALDGSSAEHVATIFRTLSSPVQLRLLDLLLDHERHLDECCEHLDLPDQQALEHLAHLQHHGYVAACGDDGRHYYRVADARVTEIVRLSRSLTSGRVAELTSCDLIADTPRSSSETTSEGCD